MGDRITITFSKSYLEDLAKLPVDAQEHFANMTRLFALDQNHPSLYRKVFQSGDKVEEIRADIYYRCLFRHLGNRHYLFMIACPHSATNNVKQFKNRLSGNFDDGIDVLIPADAEIDAVTADVHVEQESVQETVRLFGDLSGSYLRRIGIPDNLIKLTKAIPNKEFLNEIKDIYDGLQYELLSYLSEGFSQDDVNELAEQGKRKAEDATPMVPSVPTPAGTPLPRSRRRAGGLFESKLQGSLENWRIFLHPDQDYLVKKEFNGPVKVTGGAGTGKTVTAIYRAKYLAERLENGQKILFTSYNKNFTADVSKILDQLIPDKEVRGRIEVTNIDKWVNNYYSKIRQPGFSLVYDLSAEWDIAYKVNELPELDIDFYKTEWEQVVIDHEAFIYERYSLVSRAGRPFPRMAEDKRKQVWKVISAFMQVCRGKKKVGIHRAMFLCLDDIRHKKVSLYRSIVVDEAQDLSTTAYKLLRVMTGAEHPNDLFIVGDTRQRIYARNQSFSDCGIHVRGRSYTLKVNYRTPEEIRKDAFKILEGLRFDDMDGGLDLGAGYHSLLSGNPPSYECFKNVEAEVNFIAERVRSLVAEGSQLKNICLALPSRRSVKIYLTALVQRHLKCIELDKDWDDRTVDGIRVATLHRVKGLEFDHMFIAGMSDKSFPAEDELNRSNDDVVRGEIHRRNRCLLYVAMTRARHSAVITAPGILTRYIQQKEQAK